MSFDQKQTETFMGEIGSMQEKDFLNGSSEVTTKKIDILNLWILILRKKIANSLFQMRWFEQTQKKKKKKRKWKIHRYTFNFLPM